MRAWWRDAGAGSRLADKVAGSSQPNALVTFGASRYTRALDALRLRLAQREGLPANRYFEVNVPALNVRFLGRIVGGNPLLTSVTTDARFGFREGLTMPARQAFGRMVAAARAHNGLPT